MAKRWWTGAVVMGGAVPGVTSMTLAPSLHLRNPNSADDHRKHHFKRREKETAAATNINDSNNNPNNDDGNAEDSAGSRATGTTGWRPHASRLGPRTSRGHRSSSRGRAPARSARMSSRSRASPTSRKPSPPSPAEARRRRNPERQRGRYRRHASQARIAARGRHPPWTLRHPLSFRDLLDGAIAARDRRARSQLSRRRGPGGGRQCRGQIGRIGPGNGGGSHILECTIRAATAGR
ncbi:hypothetical protein C4D60_Mb10t04660 [Musa balbisiana]|uniref:Uncharacterized protein n=1 Tax=Musa balbisiana TaxID=52838 RepID=A0A4S8IW11_MUSBA|nr:hypothetical protein C4D60_Mb10t04660 [Musa balbisiana]